MTARRFDTFIGVDFSGAVDGGRRTWIAVAEPRGEGLALTGLFPAVDLPGSGRRPEAFVPALAEFLAEQRNTLAGMDFPFGLPRALVGADSWPAFVQGFAARYPDASAFRAACRAASGSRELKRRCDVEARTPFSAYNLRLYRQTWLGIGGLLAPLVATGRVGVAPMLPGPDGVVLLAEACPASTLRRLGAAGTYKGPGDAARTHRATILNLLLKNGVEVPDIAYETAIKNRGGDALDAVIAAFALWQTAGTAPDTLLTPRDGPDRLEARVYF